MKKCIVVTAILIFIFAISACTNSKSSLNDKAVDSTENASKSEVNTSSKSSNMEWGITDDDFSYSDTVIKVEIFSADNELLKTIDDEEILRPLNENKGWSYSSDHDAFLEKDVQKTLLDEAENAGVNFIYKVYFDGETGNFTLTTHTDSNICMWSIDMSNMETYGLIANPFVFYQKLPDNFLEYLSSLN